MNVRMQGVRKDLEALDQPRPWTAEVLRAIRHENAAGANGRHLPQPGIEEEHR